MYSTYPSVYPAPCKPRTAVKLFLSTRAPHQVARASDAICHFERHRDDLLRAFFEGDEVITNTQRLPRFWAIVTTILLVLSHHPLCHCLLLPALDLSVSRPFLFHPGAQVGEQQEVVSCVRSTEAWTQNKHAPAGRLRERDLSKCSRNALGMLGFHAPEGSLKTQMMSSCSFSLPRRM